MNIRSITAEEAQQQVAEGAMLIDIREPDEYARENIPAARLLSLSEIEKGARLTQLTDKDRVIFHCQSGMRSAANAAILATAASPARVLLMEGGLNSWKKAGQPVVLNRSQPLPVMRQVQMVAGGLTLLGVVSGYLINPTFFLLSGFVGAGLLFAGISGFCGLARLLNMMPWNRRHD